MATLREIRSRIIGVKKTQKITKAMKMVAAAKLRRAQNNVVRARPYAKKIKELLQHLSANPETAGNIFLQERAVNAVALVVVTADRGLCGAFNSNLIKAAERHIATHYATLKEEGKLKVFCIGKKGADYFTKRGYALAGRYVGIYNNLVFPPAQAIAHEIVNGYSAGEYDRVEIVYNEFKSVTQPRIAIEQFLPIPKEAFEGAARRPVDYIYEPSDVALMNALIPKHLNFQVWRVILESNAAEQGARMAAMENATTNANTLISTLQLSYNKARQAAITKELLEIVGGAEALRKAG
ncbi:MAG: ATP synthase F1 subunit gamma [Ignavibacteria bacterium]